MNVICSARNISVYEKIMINIDFRVSIYALPRCIIILYTNKTDTWGMKKRYKMSRETNTAKKKRNNNNNSTCNFVTESGTVMFQISFIILSNYYLPPLIIQVINYSKVLF